MKTVIKDLLKNADSLEKQVAEYKAFLKTNANPKILQVMLERIENLSRFLKEDIINASKYLKTEK